MKQLYWNNKGSISIELIGKWVLGIIIIAVGIGLIYALLKPTNTDSIHKQIAEMVRGSEIPICRAYDNLEKINEIDFQALCFARATDKCNSSENNITLDFVLSKDFFEKFLVDFNFVSGKEPLVFYKDACESFTGYDGFIVQSEKNKILFLKGEKIKIANLNPGVGICPLQ